MSGRRGAGCGARLCAFLVVFALNVAVPLLGVGNASIAGWAVPLSVLVTGVGIIYLFWPLLSDPHDAPGRRSRAPGTRLVALVAAALAVGAWALEGPSPARTVLALQVLAVLVLCTPTVLERTRLRTLPGRLLPLALVAATTALGVVAALDPHGAGPWLWPVAGVFVLALVAHGRAAPLPDAAQVRARVWPTPRVQAVGVGAFLVVAALAWWGTDVLAAQLLRGAAVLLVISHVPHVVVGLALERQVAGWDAPPGADNPGTDGADGGGAPPAGNAPPHGSGAEGAGPVHARVRTGPWVRPWVARDAPVVCACGAVCGLALVWLEHRPELGVVHCGRCGAAWREAGWATPDAAAYALGLGDGAGVADVDTDDPEVSALVERLRQEAQATP